MTFAFSKKTRIARLESARSNAGRQPIAERLRLARARFESAAPMTAAEIITRAEQLVKENPGSALAARLLRAAKRVEQ